jgi:hypothetical protein
MPSVHIGVRQVLGAGERQGWLEVASFSLEAPSWETSVRLEGRVDRAFDSAEGLLSQPGSV